MTYPTSWKTRSRASHVKLSASKRIATPWPLFILCFAFVLGACGAEPPTDERVETASLQQAAEETPIDGYQPPSGSGSGGGGPSNDELACLTQAAPIIDRRRTTPAIDPLTCLDLTPTVALVNVEDLPASIRSRLPEKSAQGEGLPSAPTRAAKITRRLFRKLFRQAQKRLRFELDLNAYDPDDWMLLYVPPMDENGRRIATLTGDPECDPDPCPQNTQCGDPTEEKCPAPDAAQCASQIPLPNQGSINLAARSIEIEVGDANTVQTRPYRGVIIAANEIVLEGPVRTGGTDLVLLTHELNAAPGASLDASALRRASGLKAAGGGALVVAADQIDVSSGFGFRSNGGPGGLPSTLAGDIRIHPDCASEGGVDLWGNPACFPCVVLEGAESCDVSAKKIMVRAAESRCVTHTELSYDREGAQYFTYVADYPTPPTTFPWSVMTKAPNGQKGGVAGKISVLYRQIGKSLPLSYGAGEGSEGLSDYLLRDPFWKSSCPTNIDCFTDNTGSAWRVKAGKKGKTPPSFGELLVPDDPAAFSAASQIEELIALIAGEFVGADEALHLADEAYRQAKWPKAKAHYAAALELLANESSFPCIKRHHRALSGIALGKLAQLDADLDYYGRAPDWAPFTPPQVLQGIVLSKLQHSTSVAIDLKLNALIAMESAAQQALIANHLNTADGVLAQKEQEVHDYTTKELQTRMEELSTYAQRAQAEIPLLQADLLAYWSGLSNPPEGMADAIMGVAGAAFELVGKIQTVVTSSFGFGWWGALATAGKAGYTLYEKIDKLKEKIDKEASICSGDATCQKLRHRLEQARLELFAARKALQAATYALKAQKAAEELFQARRDASRDVVKKLQQNSFEIRSFAKVARAGRALCGYGRLLVDDAAADLFAFKRAAALWDVPTPGSNTADYDGGGAHYDYDFVQLLDENCKSADCTLWGEYNQFLTARLAQVVPNSSTLYLGTPSDGYSTTLAGFLHFPVDVQVSDGNGGSTLTQRAEFNFGIFENVVGQFFGASPTALAKVQGATGAPVYHAADRKTDGAIQALQIEVSALTNLGPLRFDFPFRVSRASAEIYRNQSNPPVELEASVSIPLARELDEGSLLDELTYQVQTSRFTYKPCCDLVSNPVARPESLRKEWTLWVPICGSGENPGTTCATLSELQTITSLSLAVSTRYKAL